ncbi:MAG TPA: SpaA isopeptide-forming pilin-related protein, partial [Thermomicrobiales bacterium]|nr:SpaA isopeptide-forming pilin-related protein [Thermomicrobiales bacterium]
GACFSFYFSAGGTVLGSWLGNQCDGSDGRNDGITHIVLDGVEGRLVALEYLAPRGYVAGKKVAFTKERGTFKNVRLEQVAGGVSVKVTTYKGATTSKLPNACYGLYRAVGTTWEFMTVACDGWDGAADGVVRIVGVAAGTYRLYQTTTPAGYKMPAYVSVTVGTTTKSVVVRTYPAP